MANPVAQPQQQNLKAHPRLDGGQRDSSAAQFRKIEEILRPAIDAHRFLCNDAATAGKEDPFMLPFVHIGPFAFASYGVMMATGWLVGFYMVRAAARRLGVALNVGLLTFAIGLSGLLASKLYLVVESPARLLSHPAEIWHRTGFTFYGAVLGVIAIIPVLARFNRVSTWTLLDLLSPACALGYGIGRVGCFLAGDGDYGKPTTLPWGMTYPHGIVPTDIPVHPTELYEIAISIAIATHLWRLLNSRGSLWAVPGAVFSQYLIWTGLARFIVEFIKLNPIVFWGLTNAQIVGALSVAAGLLLWQGTRAKAVNAKTSSQGAVLGGAFRFRTTAD